MQEFSHVDLNQILNTCEGVDRNVSEQDLDTPFTELDIDSLTLVELAERIASAYRVPVPTEIIEDFRTPRLALDYINSHLSGHGDR